MNHNQIFENLFVLEMANNHLGDIDRGLELIRSHASVVRHNGIKAAIKLQFRDVKNFIHDKYEDDKERYIKKTKTTSLTEAELSILVDEIVSSGCLPMATPFDEVSVDACVKFGFKIIKIASSDIDDWPLIEKIATTKLPVIISTGGATENVIDQTVKFFANRNIPLAINHCVSIYPSEDSDLELNQINYLKRRYPSNVIGFSTHEKTSWDASMYISYAKGARTWERHVDIERDGIQVSEYNSLPHQIDQWFKAYRIAQTMSGSSAEERRVIQKKERQYLDNLLRGIYARIDIPEGTQITNENFDQFFKLQIPLLKGQLSCREVINGIEISEKLSKGKPVRVEHVKNSIFFTNESLRKQLENRGR